jgi:ABC-2 type transport system permease protein
MSALTSISPAVGRRSPGRPVTQRQVLRSEWIKLWSLRSSRWLFGLGVVGLLLGIAAAEFNMAHWAHYTLQQKRQFSPIDTALTGWQLSQLGIGLLGILIICGEYSTGMIRSTMMAVPRRLPVLWAKLVVLTSVTFAASLPVTFVGFFAASAVLTQHHVNPSLTSPHALRCVVAVPLFLTALVVFTVSLGAIVRNIAGGLAIYAGLVFALPALVGVLSTSLKNTINPYLPSSAATAFTTARPDPADHLLHPWVGFALFCGYSAVLLVAAVITLARRDV